MGLETKKKIFTTKQAQSNFSTKRSRVLAYDSILILSILAGARSKRRDYCHDMIVVAPVLLYKRPTPSQTAHDRTCFDNAGSSPVQPRPAPPARSILTCPNPYRQPLNLILRPSFIPFIIKQPLMTNGSPYAPSSIIFAEPEELPSGSIDYATLFISAGFATLPTTLGHYALRPHCPP